MKLDCNIYGEDSTSTASEVAGKALSAPKLIDPFDSANASKGGGGDAVVSNSTTSAKDGLTSDSRAVSKGGHATTPGTKRGKE